MIRKVLVGSTVYADGVDYLGIALEFTPPTITMETVTQNQPGHAAPIEIATGRLEALEASFVMGDAVPEVEALVGAPHAVDVPLTFVSRVTDGATARVETHELAGVWTKAEASSMGEAASADAGRHTYTVSIRTLRHLIDGAEVRRIDVEANEHVVNGVPVLDPLRAALGP